MDGMRCDGVSGGMRLRQRQRHREREGEGRSQVWSGFGDEMG